MVVHVFISQEQGLPVFAQLVFVGTNVISVSEICYSKQKNINCACMCKNLYF